MTGNFSDTGGAPLYFRSHIRLAEKAAFETAPSFAVMTAAAKAVAAAARKMTRTRRPLLIVAGPGNNGGDALLAGALLLQEGRPVRLVFLGDIKKQSADAKLAFAHWRKAGGESPMSEVADGDYDLLIDGLFGIGLCRPLEGDMRRAVAAMNRQNCPRLAIDTPSGLDADNGGVLGAAVQATCTVTFFAAKPGLFTGDGAALAGEVMVRDLGFAAGLPPPPGELLQDARQLTLSPLKRKRNSHKGQYGALALVGGAPGMMGALVLAARAAVRTGCGKVFAVCERPPAVDWRAPEIMWRAALPPEMDCIAIGMGLGGGDNRGWLQTAVSSPLPLLLDADALNQIAASESLATLLRRRTAATVITPHPAEAARLLSTTTAKVQQRRIAAAQELAQKFNAVAVLKGAGSVICAPDGKWRICHAGNPGLAQAGVGDVLAGMTAALLAQTQNGWLAACAGVFLHAKAADSLAAKNGEIGLDINLLAATGARLLNRALRQNV